MASRRSPAASHSKGSISYYFICSCSWVRGYGETP